MLERPAQAPMPGAPPWVWRGQAPRPLLIGSGFGRARHRRPREVESGDPRLRALAAATLVAAGGLGAFSTVLLFYLTRTCHFSTGRVGIALTAAGLAALLASVPAGRMADRASPVRVYALALLGQGAACATLVLAAHTYAQFTAAACANAAAYQAKLAARGALVSALAAPGREATLVAWLRTITNIGVSLGVPVGGLALAADRAGAYRAAMLAAAAAYVIAALILARVRVRPRRRARRAAVDGGARPLRDGRYVLFTVVTAIQSLQYPLLEFAVPLCTLSTRAPRWTIAAAGLLNTAVVVALQVRATKRASEPKRAAWMPASAGLLVAAACVALGAAPGRGALLAVVLIAAGVLALSLGEVRQTAASDTLSFTLAPSDAHGAYQGLFAVGPGLAVTAGPWLLAAVVLPHGRVGMAAAGAALAAAGLATPIIAARARAENTAPSLPAAASIPYTHTRPSRAAQHLTESPVHVLAATRRPFARYPVADWLGPGAEVTMLGCAQNSPDGTPSTGETRLIPGYEDSAAFDLAVLDAHRARPIDHLIVFSELDILRAARLRERLGIAGQGYASALAYRDKVVMKQYWQAAGVPAAPHAALHAAADLLAFAGQVGYPVVVKPRAGMGSMGVSVLTGEHDARCWLAEHWRNPAGGESPWMAEAHIGGTMMQVDGLYHDGGLEVNWPTSVSSLLACFEGEATLSLTLPAADPLVPEVQALVAAALAALPHPGGPLVYHAEVWRDTDGRLLMNEVAARIGGGQTRQIVELAFGVDLVRRLVEGTVDPDTLRRPVAALPHGVVGDVGVPPRHGRLIAAPALPADLTDAPWMARAAVTGQSGRSYHGPASSVDTVAECLVTGASVHEAGARLNQFATWCEANLLYQSEDPAIALPRPSRAPVGVPAAIAA